MLQPWELPHHEEKHHAIPLENGLWRGPRPESKACEQALQKKGLVAVGESKDCATRYYLAPHFIEAPKENITFSGPVEVIDLTDPEARATWITQRIAVGLQSWKEFPQHPPAFMAILNLTPDSFSDGGTLTHPTTGQISPDRLLERVAEHEQHQAAWLDLGAESTRPGAKAIPAQQQLEQLLPAISLLHNKKTPLSVDTRSAEVAEACLQAGATMVNDVSALADPLLARVCAQHSCRIVLMHHRGTPETMQNRTTYAHLLGEVADALAARAAYALSQGIHPSQILLDPGIGFAKDTPSNLKLLGHCGALRALGFPLLLGPSRKSFMSTLLPQSAPAQRDLGSAGAAAICAAQGVYALRMHTGRFQDAWQMAWSIANASSLIPRT